MPAQQDELFLCMRKTSDGLYVLHFPFISFSDLHLGSRSSRAKRACMMLGNTSCNRLDGVGDIIDGLHLMKKSRLYMGPWHKQAIAHLLRKAGEGTEVNIYPGNHEVGMREKIGKGKTLYDVHLLPFGEYIDPKGRRLKIEHSDLYDRQVFETEEDQANWYVWGDLLFEGVQEFDRTMQGLPFKRMEKFSIAARVKRMAKERINKRLGIQDAIEKDIDQGPYDGMIYGHTHIKGFHRTPGGKLLINDGCGTEHFEFVAIDVYGNIGIVTWHRDGMNIEMESGREYFVSWQELGKKYNVDLNHFSQDPVMIEDEYTKKADRVLGLAYRMWPSEELVACKKLWDSCTSIINQNGALPSVLMENFLRAEWKIREAQDILRQLSGRGRTIYVPNSNLEDDLILTP